MCEVNGPRLMIMDVLVMPGASGTVVYDYGILHPAEPRALHCPGGRTDDAGGVELGGDTAVGSRVIEHVNFVI